MVRYLLDEYRGSTSKNYAIGLKALDNYKGVYEWHRVDNSEPLYEASLTFTNWATSAPTGKDCVYMSVGDTDTQNGLWKDIDCSTTGLYAICEYDPTYKSDNSTYQEEISKYMEEHRMDNL